MFASRRLWNRTETVSASAPPARVIGTMFSVATAIRPNCEVSPIIAALATTIALVYVIGSYFLESLGKVVDALKPFRPIALFHYYDSSAALFEGINWGDIGILLALTALLFSIAVLAFQRRDIAV